jgi:hypothetical protein
MDSAVFIFMRLIYIARLYRIVDDIAIDAVVSRGRKILLLDNCIAISLVPERAAPLHHPVVSQGELHFYQLHNPGYRRASINGPYDKMEAVIHDAGYQFGIIFALSMNIIASVIKQRRSCGSEQKQ